LKTTITARQSPTAFSELYALLSDHDYMLGKTRAPAPSITSSFAASYTVGSPSMPEARQAQLSELAAQLSALRFQVSPIAPSSSQAFYGDRSSNNNNNSNNNNRGNRNSSRGNNNNRGHDTGANSHVTPNLEAMDNSEAYYGDAALHVGNESPYVIPTTDHRSPSSPRSTISFPSSVSQLSPTSQISPESSNAQPSPVSTTSVPTPPPSPPSPPPPITRQHLVNLRQSPRQRVPTNFSQIMLPSSPLPSLNQHRLPLPTTL
ncbi:hypothetical protein Tco_0298669, partial [Tanacetum coccineum]